MKILSYLFIVAALLLAAHAHASTSFDFWSATDGSYTCSAYCQGFSTDDPAHRVDSVGVTVGSLILVNGVWTQTYVVNLSVDGVPY